MSGVNKINGNASIFTLPKGVADGANSMLSPPRSNSRRSPLNTNTESKDLSVISSAQKQLSQNFFSSPYQISLPTILEKVQDNVLSDTNLIKEMNSCIDFLSSENIDTETKEYLNKLAVKTYGVTQKSIIEFTGYLQKPESYKNKTDEEKDIFKLKMMRLAAHPGDFISQFAREFLFSLENKGIPKDHPMSEVVQEISECPEFSTIKKFFELAKTKNNNDELNLPTIAGFLDLFIGGEVWKRRVNLTGISKEELRRDITVSLLDLANSQDEKISNPIFDFADYVSESKWRENQDALDISGMILAMKKMSNLKISSDKNIADIDITEFKKTLINYIKENNGLEKGEKNKFVSDLTHLVNSEDKSISEPIYNILILLNKSKTLSNPWILEGRISIENEFLSFVRENENKSKKTKMARLAVNISSLNKGDKTSINNQSLRDGINHLLSLLYNSETGESTSPAGEAKTIIDFLGVLVKTEQWENEKASELALNTAKLIENLKNFLTLKSLYDTKAEKSKNLSENAKEIINIIDVYRDTLTKSGQLKDAYENLSAINIAKLIIDSKYFLKNKPSYDTESESQNANLFSLATRTELLIEISKYFLTQDEEIKKLTLNILKSKNKDEKNEAIRFKEEFRKFITKIADESARKSALLFIDSLSNSAVWGNHWIKEAASSVIKDESKYFYINSISQSKINENMEKEELLKISSINLLLLMLMDVKLNDYLPLLDEKNKENWPSVIVNNLIDQVNAEAKNESMPVTDLLKYAAQDADAEKTDKYQMRFKRWFIADDVLAVVKFQQSRSIEVQA